MGNGGSNAAPHRLEEEEQLQHADMARYPSVVVSPLHPEPGAASRSLHRRKKQRAPGPPSPRWGRMPDLPRLYHQPEAKKASPPPAAPEPCEPKSPSRTFYFGMDKTLRGSQLSPHLTGEQRPPTPPSRSDNEVANDDADDGADGLKFALRLRPILPRKQLQVPRFSPATAWKLLSSLESSQSVASDEGLPIFEEEKIEKFPRPGPRSNDKSGDSGISGDAGLPDSFRATDNFLMKRNEISWTPQQDLEESSSEGGSPNLNALPPMSRSHIFSLSLPRDNQLSAAFLSDQRSSSFKRSASMFLVHNDNWLLSRSAPNSLNSALEPRLRPQTDIPAGTPNGRRLMYLPSSEKQKPSYRPRKAEPSPVSKSCENVYEAAAADKVVAKEPPARKHKRFTFQSTIRQIERRRISEKLSKEAEEKERRRLDEVRAMQRVEEEFQRKRNREKAAIRQRLRLYASEQVLSEFRDQDCRDYREYRRRGPDDALTVHPQLVCDLPRVVDAFNHCKYSRFQ